MSTSEPVDILLNKPFPTRLRELIKEKSSQGELATAIGVTRQTISLYTYGQTIPDIEKFEKIANYFKVSSDYLLGMSDAKDSDNDGAIKELHLSEKAVQAIKESDEECLETLSLLLEDKRIFDVLSRYFHSPLSQQVVYMNQDGKLEIVDLSDNGTSTIGFELDTRRKYKGLKQEEVVRAITFSYLERYISSVKTKYDKVHVTDE